MAISEDAAAVVAALTTINSTLLTLSTHITELNGNVGNVTASLQQINSTLSTPSSNAVQLDNINNSLQLLNLTLDTVNKDTTQQLLNRNETQLAIHTDINLLANRGVNLSEGICVYNTNVVGGDLHSMERAMKVNSLKQSGSLTAVIDEIVNPTIIPFNPGV
jgi:hypothetical protein